jgi:hypothetical protein
MFEGFARQARRMPLTEEQKAVARLLRKYYGTVELYMSHKSFHTLTHRFGHLDIVQRVFSMIATLYPTRYARRWARRLRKFGFGREDALMISMGSFSADKPYKGRLLEIDKIITLDKRMYDRFQNHYNKISTTFTKMIIALDIPFNTVKLPQIGIPPETEQFELP